MGAAHLHVFLNQVPLFGLIGGLLLLAFGLGVRSPQLRIAAYAVFVLSSIAALGAYTTGGAAASFVERIPGGTEAAIERHQDAATVAVVLICLTGIFSIAAFFADAARWLVRTGIVVCIFALGIVALACVGYTANLGGLIHQAEITASK